MVQKNLHKIDLATIEVRDKLKENDGRVFICQEPAHSKGKISYLSNNNIEVFVGDQANPRTCIALNKSYKALLQSEFSNKDLVTISLNTSNDKQLFICSLYLPYEANEIPNTLVRNLISHCEQHSIDIIIGADANAHHHIWGSNDTNQRGETLLEYILSTNLDICNVGN